MPTLLAASPSLAWLAGRGPLKLLVPLWQLLVEPAARFEAFPSLAPAVGLVVVQLQPWIQPSVLPAVLGAFPSLGWGVGVQRVLLALLALSLLLELLSLPPALSFFGCSALHQPLMSPQLAHAATLCLRIVFH